MAFAIGNNRSRMVNMNITPLVDVMLVLLIIFMVTMPLRTNSIRVDLPQPGPLQKLSNAKPIALRIDADGQIGWNGSALPLNSLEATMKVEAERYTDPLISR